MKWFLLVLLTANMIYFGWQLDKDTKQAIVNASQGIQAPASVHELKKISELEEPLVERKEDILLSQQQSQSQSQSQRQRQDSDSRADLLDTLSASNIDNISSLVNTVAAADVIDDLSTDGDYSCLSFGPIPEKKIALMLLDWFQSRNLHSEIDADSKQTRQLFWIYLTPVSNRAIAISMLESLQNKGVEDYRLINQGELSNAISLGLFSSQTVVNKRLAELHDKGFNPVVVPYAEVKTVYRLNVRVIKASTRLDEIFSGYPAGFNSIPVKCEEIF